MSTGDRFIELRKALSKNGAIELSQTEAGALIGVNRNSWRRYELGELPNGQAMARLAELGVSIDWLLTGQGPMLIGEPSTTIPNQEINDDKDKELEELRAALEQEKSKTAEWKAGATNLLAGCIMAIDNMVIQQRINLPLKQRAAAITSMFIEMGSLSPEEIHERMAKAQKEKDKKGGLRR